MRTVGIVTACWQGFLATISNRWGNGRFHRSGRWQGRKEASKNQMQCSSSGEVKTKSDRHSISERDHDRHVQIPRNRSRPTRLNEAMSFSWWPSTSVLMRSGQRCSRYGTELSISSIEHARARPPSQQLGVTDARFRCNIVSSLNKSCSRQQVHPGQRSSRDRHQ